MLFLAETLLKAAGFQYDQTEDTWVVPVHLPPVVTVACDEGDKYIIDALVDVHEILEAVGCTYNNFAINGGYVSLVGPRRTHRSILGTAETVVAYASRGRWRRKRPSMAMRTAV
jgi:hypothetical protein